MVHHWKENLTARRTACVLVLLLAASALTGCGERSKTVTPNAAEEPTTFRIAFGSCAHQWAEQPIWDAVLAAEPDVFVFLGDAVYADGFEVEKVRQAFAQLDAKPGFKKLRQTIPLLATWDDHDYGRNDGGRDHPDREAMQTVFLDWLGVPAHSPRRDRAGVYSAHTFDVAGRRVQLILLDTRYHRTPLKKIKAFGAVAYVPTADPDQTMLGDAQWAWLEDQLLAPADVRIIGSSIQFLTIDHPGEKWANLPRERRRMLDLIDQTHADHVLFISGDIHIGELSKMPRPHAYPIYDLTSSGLTHPRPGSPPQRYRIDPLVTDKHFGLIHLDLAADTPVVRLQLHTRSGRTPIDHRVRLTELTH